MDVEKLRKTLNYIIGQEPFDTTWTVSTRHLLRLVNDAVEEEREACAKICDEQSDKDGFEGCYADACAEAIRSRT